MVEGEEAAFWVVAAWARKAARKLEKKVRLVAVFGAGMVNYGVIGSGGMSLVGGCVELYGYCCMHDA